MHTRDSRKDMFDMKEDEKYLTQLHNHFLHIIKNNPSLYFVILTEEQLYVYNRDTDEFTTTNGEIKTDLFNRDLYYFVPERRTFLLCLVSFNNLDELLDYIRAKTFKEDFRNYIENIRYADRIDTEM